MYDNALTVTLDVIATLEQLQIPYLVGGSMASALHGFSRTTLDSDLVADVRPEHVPTLGSVDISAQPDESSGKMNKTEKTRS